MPPFGIDPKAIEAAAAHASKRADETLACLERIEGVLEDIRRGLSERKP
jgi:flavin-binding protein dodecin